MLLLGAAALSLRGALRTACFFRCSYKINGGEDVYLLEMPEVNNENKNHTGSAVLNKGC